MSHYTCEERGGEYGPYEVVPIPSVVNTNPVESRSTNDLMYHNMSISRVFANIDSSDEDIYPPTINEIAQEQRRDRRLKKYFRSNLSTKDKDKHLSLKVYDVTEVVVYKDKLLVIPDSLKDKVIAWYHHYLMHPGHTRLEETITATMYWKSLRSDLRRHVKRCPTCQVSKKRKRKYGKLPVKLVETVPWRGVCVDLIGPYTLKATDGTILDFMCLTMIDPASGWFEILSQTTHR